TLLTAHRELEKLVLTPRQQRIKELVAQPYGDLVHEGQLLDPVCRDIEALMQSSQDRVTGDVHVLFRPGSLFVEGVESPYSLMAASKGVYGEAAGEWTAADALGFSKIVSLTGVFHRRAGERASQSKAGRLTAPSRTRRRSGRWSTACEASWSTRSPPSPRRAVCRTRCASRPTFPPRKAWWSSSRCSRTSRPTTRSSSRAAAWPRSARATSSWARSAI